MRDKFLKNAPVDHSLVVEYPKAKRELEEHVKKKFESLPSPWEKIKLTGRVGAASEATKISSKHFPFSKENILANIETKNSTSYSTEDVTSNHLEPTTLNKYWPH